MAAFKWFRGGRWVIEDDAFLRLEGTEQLKPIQYGSRHGTQEYLATGFSFRSDPDRWANQVASVTGVRRYELNERGARQVIRRLREGLEDYKDVTRISQARPARRQLILREIGGLLEECGPLSTVPGIVEFHSAPHAESSPGRVNAQDFLDSALILAHIEEDFQLAATDQRRVDMLEKLVLHEASSSGFTKELAVGPVLHGTDVRLEVSALTLGGFLWASLLEFGRGVTRRCLWCDEQFELSDGRGLPAKYCPEHRSSKFRWKYKRRLARESRASENLRWDV